MKLPLLIWRFHGNCSELSQLSLPGVIWQVTFSGISHYNFIAFIFNNFSLLNSSSDIKRVTCFLLKALNNAKKGKLISSFPYLTPFWVITDIYSPAYVYTFCKLEKHVGKKGPTYMSLLLFSSYSQGTITFSYSKICFLNYNTSETFLQANMYSSTSFKYSLQIHPEIFSCDNGNFYFPM